ncbi:MAG: DUF5412 domain-containing protein [Tissierellaceae bacterium]
MMRKIMIIILIIIAILSYGIYWLFFDMERLPKHKLVAQEISSNGTYTIKAYRSDGGATVSYAILGELNYNKINRKPKNIYWNYREDKAIIEWIDDNTVIINGHKLDVRREKFDFRREK